MQKIATLLGNSFLHMLPGDGSVSAGLLMWPGSMWHVLICGSVWDEPEACLASLWNLSVLELLNFSAKFWPGLRFVILPCPSQHRELLEDAPVLILLPLIALSNASTMKSLGITVKKQSRQLT